MDKQNIQLKITPEMVKNGTHIKCEGCENLVFTEKVIFVKISAILSPSGKIEVIPMPIIMCDRCGKVSSIFDPQNLVPKQLKVKVSKVALKPASETKLRIVKD